MDSPYGHDIGPDETRMHVDVITGFSCEPGAESAPIHQQLFLNRPANHVFHEPIDYSGTSSVDPLTPSSRSEHQKFHYERERLKTFDNVWKSEYPVTKEDLAKDGFIYKGPHDCTMCVFCLKSIKNWESGDTVPGEHKRLYPRCPWVCGKLHHMNKPISRADLLRSDIGINARGLPLFSDMTMSDERLNSYQYWKGGESLSQQLVHSLTKAGFFYDENCDAVRCYKCGWKIDRPGISSDVYKLHSSDCPGTCKDYNNGHMTDEKNRSDSYNSNHTSDSAHGVAEEDMRSPAVQAVLFSCDGVYSTEEIMKAVRMLSISKGSGHITSEDIINKLDSGS